MLHDVLMRMVSSGNTDGLREKIDVFYAADRLTQEEYTKLTGMLEE